jgi:hypothetical protein
MTNSFQPETMNEPPRGGLFESQSDIIAMLESKIASVQNGWGNALELFVELDRIAKIAAEFKTEIKSKAIDEAYKHPKQFNAFGVKIERRGIAGRWTYPDFTPYVQAKERAKVLESLMQKAGKSGVQLLDAETGEVVPQAEYKDGGETLAITYPK